MRNSMPSKSPNMEGRCARRRVSGSPCFPTRPCDAGERRRHGARALRRAARHDEERPDLGQSGRFTQLEPVIRRTFDIASMARLVGRASWAGLSEAQRQQVTESFGRYISAIYADRFDSYAGQKLQVTGEQPDAAGVMVQQPDRQGQRRAGQGRLHDAPQRRWLADLRHLPRRRDQRGGDPPFRIRRHPANDGVDGLIAALNRKADMLTGTTAKAD